jgi:GntR family transcriptional regulator
VLSALRELRDQGLVLSQQGRGTFVRDDAVERLRGTGSAEFQLLSEKLDAITAAVEALAARVHDLEDVAQAARLEGVKSSPSPDEPGEPSESGETASDT